MTPDPCSPPQAGSSPVQAEVTERLRQAILTGEYGPGSRLPPERALAEQLGVSRLTLRAALSGLASQGLVRPRRGSGVEVLDFRRNASLDLFSWLLALPASGSKPDPEKVVRCFAEIVHLRRLIALDTLERAAQSVSEADLADLRALAAEQEANLDDPPRYRIGDHEYQRRILRIAGSVAVELLFNSFEKVLERHQDLELAFMGPLEVHHASYALVQALLAQGATPGLREAAAEVLDLAEAEGLDRVRERLGA